MSDLKELQERLSELAIGTYKVDRAKFLEVLIGTNAGTINEKTYGQFFGDIQDILWSYRVLMIARLFEGKQKGYSKHTLKEFFECWRKVNTSTKPDNITPLIEYCSLKNISVENADVVEVTIDALESSYNQHVSKSEDGGGLAEKFIFLRNKEVAHNEMIDSKNLPTHKFEEVTVLMAFVKLVVSLVGMAYFRTYYSDQSGNFFMENDAFRSSICLSRLLEAASVIDDYKLAIRRVKSITSSDN